MNAFTQKIKDIYSHGTVVTRLIYVNIAVYLVIKLIGVFTFLFNVDTDVDTIALTWLAVPAGLSPLLHKPWSVLTYMFLHVDFFHVLSNMIMLYFGGKLFHEYLGARRLLSTYLAGGFFGALLFIIFFNLFPVFTNAVPFAQALGASASVLAIFVAIATYLPEFQVNLLFLGPVRLKWVALVIVLLDLISINKGNPGGHIAHLGGALFGYISIIQLKKGNDITSWISKFTNWLEGLFKRKSHMKVAYKRKRTVDDEEYNLNKKKKQQRIDSILDKISRSGYDSLTKEEKETLFKASNDKD
jgi:membrane associated rhomboid family serine protease